MNPDKIISRIPSRYWGYLALLTWGAAALFTMRHDAYSLNEGGARALLLVWSVADQVASSVVTFGAPDMRILLFAPAGFLWTGSVFAAKVFTGLALAWAAWLLYQWKQRAQEPECALIATGLLLISPLALEQVDTLAPGAFLLMAFAWGAWLDRTYRAQPRAFGGWYFAQLFTSALATSLHPAGLAYPIALLWSWYKNPVDQKQQKYFFAGVGFVTLATLVMELGWNDIAWLQNPLKVLSAIATGTPLNEDYSAMHWTAGAAILALLVFVVIRQFRALWSEFTGRLLLFGLVLGLVTCDPAWGMIALCLILFYGMPLLLGSHASGGFARQRGIVMLLLVLCSTLFMLADKSHYLAQKHGVLSEQDQLIQILAEDAEQARKTADDSDGKAPAPRFRIASQWPARTMIACQCDTLPLPPAARDPGAQLAMLHGFTHMMFNPRQPSNMALARNMAGMGGNLVETVALQPSGVLLYFPPPAPSPAASAPKAQ